MTVFTKRRLATAAAFVVGVAAGLPLAWGFIPSTSDFAGIFELENAGANATQESGGSIGPPFAAGADDWSNILSLAGSGVVPNAGKPTVDPAIATLVATTTGGVAPWPGVIPAPGGNTIAFGGGTKDINDLTSWEWNTGSAPGKNLITDAYAAAYVLNENIGGTSTNEKGDLVIFFGLDRKANNGDADLGFWFFQQTISLKPNPPAGFNGTHTVGDILVLMNFPQGSPSSPTVEILEWVASGGDVSTNLKTLTPVAGGACDTSMDQVFCGLTNTGTVTAPWPYTPKSGTVGTFPTESFFKGVINISRVFRDILKKAPSLPHQLHRRDPILHGPDREPSGLHPRLVPSLQLRPHEELHRRQSERRPDRLHLDVLGHSAQYRRDAVRRHGIRYADRRDQDAGRVLGDDCGGRYRALRAVNV